MRHTLALRDIVGQPPVRHLSVFIDRIKHSQAASKCFALVGECGTGKSATASAAAEELGCEELRFAGGLTIIDCASFGVRDCEQLFKYDVRRSVDTPWGWRVVILDEFERVSKECQACLKVWLGEGRIANRLLVIATSNDLGGISKPVLDRFKIMPYDNGAGFAAACQARLKHLWAMARPGEGLPIGMSGWGKSFDSSGFSMRSALQCLEEALAERELVCA